MRQRLYNRGFLALLVTQFFGAANDNVLKGVLTFMVIGSGRWEGRLGEGGQGLVALCFTLPFILLSGYAGQFADRNSKRRVSVLVKMAEVPIAAIAFIGFQTGSLSVTLGALILLTCQSAFFGPAKYGMIPELVESHELSRANGSINMMTNIAVIAGAYLAGIVADRYWPKPAEGDAATMFSPEPWLPGAVLVLVAGAGLLAVIFLPRLEPGDRNLKYDPNPVSTYIAALRDMSKSPLLTVALAWGYFYLLAGLALLIVPEYAVVLNISREEASRLLAILAIAIGVGSIAAGFISGHHIEPRLVPIGAAGVTGSFLLLGIVPSTFIRVAALLAVGGFFSGFYLIPLQAMLQKLSPDDERGRFLGTANAISFGFLSIASAIYWVIRPWFGTRPDRIFLISAALMLLGAGGFLLVMRRTAMRRGAVNGE